MATVDLNGRAARLVIDVLSGAQDAPEAYRKARQKTLRFCRREERAAWREIRDLVTIARIHGAAGHIHSLEAGIDRAVYGGIGLGLIKARIYLLEAALLLRQRMPVFLVRRRVAARLARAVEHLTRAWDAHGGEQRRCGWSYLWLLGFPPHTGMYESRQAVGAVAPLAVSWLNRHPGAQN